MAHRGLRVTTTTTAPWMNEQLDPGHRAQLLLAQLTIAEKCHQLTVRMPWSVVNADGTDAAGAAEVLRNPPGHIAQLILDDAGKLADMVGRIQRKVLSASRLPVPALIYRRRCPVHKPAQQFTGFPVASTALERPLEASVVGVEAEESVNHGGKR
jgi:hypothetical protein